MDNLSDHLPNFPIIEYEKVTKKNTTQSMIKDYRAFSLEKYQNDLKHIDFDLILSNTTDLDNKYELFQKNVLNVINKHAPLKLKTKRQRKQELKPWITNGILKSISSKNKLYKRYIKTKDDF